MGSLIDELQRREAAARAEAERLRGQIGELAERLAGVEEQLSRLVIAREVVDEVQSVLAAGGRDVQLGACSHSVYNGNNSARSRNSYRDYRSGSLRR
jgi:hypothetical protein